MYIPIHEEQERARCDGLALFVLLFSLYLTFMKRHGRVATTLQEHLKNIIRLEKIGLCLWVGIEGRIPSIRKKRR
jgi:hypothetical protein